MALNSSGPISLAGTTAGQSIEIENGGNGTTQISLNDAAVRTLAGVPSGAITMPTNFWGKANRVALSYTFSANTANASLNVTAIGGYIAGKSDITITVNSGIYLYSTSTGTPGLALSGGTSGDTVTLVNNGYIMGQGGAGGSSTGNAGGTALSLGFNTTVNNTNASAYIGGGGGGGGGWTGTSGGGGGGAGGGAGNGGSGGTGGGGGAIGSVGGNAGGTYNAGAGGGRIFPGTGGVGGNVGTATFATGGGAGGGGGGGQAGKPPSYWTGGSGGAGNAAGTTPIGSNAYGSGGGGGWGASGGASLHGAGTSYAGGAGGKAVNLNGNTVTWVSGNTTRVYGSVA